MYIPPLNLLFKSFGWLRRQMFLPTLKSAHSAYIRYLHALDKWEDVGEGIEILTHLARWPGEPPETESTLLIRSRAKYDAATIAVEATKGMFFPDENSEIFSNTIIFDDTRLVSGLNGSPRRLMLTGIPVFRTFVTDDGEWDTTYTAFRVRVTSLTENGATRAVDLETTQYGLIDQYLAQPHLWKPVGTDIYHVGEVVWAKEQLQIKLCLEYGLFGRLVSLGPLVTIMFWIPFVLRLRRFKPKVFDKVPPDPGAS